jgi:hypothetical protein
MAKRKAAFATTAIMSLFAVVIFFIWKFGNGTAFAIIEGVLAVYGFGSLWSDCSRWLQLPDVPILRRGGRH